MQNTPNYSNSIKRRTDATSPLQWIDVDNNFQFPNAWQPSKSYSQGMQVLWNDNLGEPFNPHGEMSYWICTSNHLSSNSNAPGTGLVWDKISGLNAEYLHGLTSNDFLQIEGGTVNGLVNFNGAYFTGSSIISGYSSIFIDPVSFSNGFLSYNGGATFNGYGGTTGISAIFLGPALFNCGFTAAGSTFSGTVQVRSGYFNIYNAGHDEKATIIYDGDGDGWGNTIINFKSTASHYETVTFDSQLSSYALKSGANTFNNLQTFSSGLTASGATFSNNVSIGATLSGGNRYSQIYFHHGSQNPANGMTYYYGDIPDSGVSGNPVLKNQVQSLISGYVTDVNIFSYSETVGSTENSIMSLNNITKSTLTIISNTFKHSVDNLSTITLGTPVRVDKGDILTIQWITPTWVTPPLTVRNRVTLNVKLD